jgi:hypothetical protein
MALNHGKALNTNGIHERLENWGRANRGAGPRDASSMTGIVCDRLRRAALGNVWSGVNVHPEVEETDADRVNAAWLRMLDVKQKRLLMWYFVRRSNPDFICRRIGIKRWPASVFDVELRKAEQAIELILAGMTCAQKS